MCGGALTPGSAHAYVQTSDASSGQCTTQWLSATHAFSGEEGNRRHTYVSPMQPLRCSIPLRSPPVS